MNRRIPTIITKRYYALPDTKGGSKAKGGQAKTAIKTKDATTDLPPLPLFQPKPKVNPLNKTPPPPQLIDLERNPAWQRPTHTLMRSIDLDLRERYDSDNRWKLFAEHPVINKQNEVNLDRVPIGSVVLVEQVSSRTVPRVQNFAGILVAVKRKGIKI